MNKKVLIVTYRLGTGSGVGGRRWMLYGKELYAKGNSVYYLTAENVIPAELSDQADKVKFYQSAGIAFDRIKGNSLIKKLLRRLHKVLISCVTPGTLFDSAKHDRRKVLESCRYFIEKEGVRNIIVTGAPFSLLYYMVCLKEEYNDLNVICDFRDKWTQGVHYGFRSLSLRRKSYEEACELKVLKHADVIVTASPDIETYLKGKIHRQYILLYNPISREMRMIANSDRSINNKTNSNFQLVHIGNIDEGCRSYLENILKLWSQISEKNPNIELIFLGSQNEWANNLIKSFGLSSVRLLPMMDQISMGNFLKGADSFLLFNREELGKSLPTKLFDYLPFRKPIITYDNKTEICNFIRENNLGLLLDEGDSLMVSQENMAKVISNNVQFNFEFNYEQMTVEYQADVLVSILK